MLYGHVVKKPNNDLRDIYVDRTVVWLCNVWPGGAGMETETERGRGRGRERYRDGEGEGEVEREREI